MTTILRLIRQSVVALLILSMLIICFIWTLLRGSLPQYSGEANLPGLTTPVNVERDSLGSVTLHAQNRFDIARALGYIHAQERFFEMDLMRRRAAGELAELFGSGAVRADHMTRRYRMRSRVSAMLKQLPVEQRLLLGAYRDGVNNGLNDLAVRPFPYLLIRTQPIEWKKEDSMLVVMAMYLTLNDSSKYRELGLSTMYATLPESAYKFLTSTGGKWDAPLVGTSLEWPQPPTAEELDLRKLDPDLLRHDYEYSDNIPGSNSFAVNGTLTDSGAALVGNDMHLELRVPNLWFRTRLIYPNPHNDNKLLDITGISLPGVPGIIAGSNRHIAWSFTNSYGDFSDWVRVTLDPQDTTRYRTSTGWKSMDTFYETIKVRSAPNETLIVNETEWGPILAEDYDEMPLALIWTALQPEAINFNLAQLELAETTHEAIVIVQNAGMPSQNFIVGDHHGNIAWTVAGRIPIRTGNYDPQLPADWSVPNTGWNGWLDDSKYPVINNPPSQRLWSANARTVDGPLFDLLGDGGYDLGARAKQIRDNLTQRDQFRPYDMLAIQLDYRAIFLTHWYHLLESSLNQARKEPWITKMQEILQDWDGHASTTSVAYPIVRTFRKEVIKNVLDGFAAAIRQSDPDFKFPRLSQVEHAVWILIEQRSQHLLPPNFNDWDDLLYTSAKQVAVNMEKQPVSLTAPSWGEFNTARIKHPLSHTLPDFIAKWLDMPADALPGDSNMPRIQTPDFGASQRFAVSPGDEENGYFDMPGGQSGHPLSPYYGSGHSHWVTENSTPFKPGPAEKILRLNPATKLP
ncbi:MAG: penicillin acylase family protein [Nitrosomonas sp.]|nr:penicillin acylase family protein [Nitrosomonas sp.]MDP1950027.1 penicillin acylase family protein [Nitrosomonas sp.]